MQQIEKARGVRLEQQDNNKSFINKGAKSMPTR